MQEWFFRSRRDPQRRPGGRGPAFQPAARSSRFELLEDRRLLTVSTETLYSFSGPANAWGNPAADLTLVGSKLFGVTAQDGGDGDGTLFSMNLDGSNYQILHTFTRTATDGANPYAGLTLVGSTLYGTTSEGGSSGDGTVFSIDTDGSDFQTVYSFGDTNNDGYSPEGGLTLDGSTLFGTTASGGSGGGGTVFSVNTNGGGYQILYSFQDTGNDAQYPYAGLTLVGSTLFGTTEYGGSNDAGTVFSIHNDGSDYQILYSFGGNDNDGFSPEGGLTIVGSTLVGTTLSGGSNGSGTVFSIGTDGSDYQSLHSFGATDPAAQGPASGLTLVGSALFGVSLQGGNDGDGTVFSISGAAPSFSVTASNRAASYSLEGPAVQVDSGLAVQSTNADVTGASVTISAGTLQSGDALHFTNQNGISGAYSGGTLTLSGSATPAQYQTALQSVTFSTTSTSTATRAISVVIPVIAGESSVAAESVVVLPTAPVATASGVTNTYFLDGEPVPIDSGLTITSADAELTGARIEISADTLDQFDTLDFTNQNGISATISSGELTLSGNATVAQYQAALQSITFWALDNSTTSRSISIAVFDGAATSNLVTETVAVSFFPPYISTSGLTNTFIPGGPPVAVDSEIYVYDYDSDLAGATVTISPDTFQAGDVLNFTDQDGISGSYSGGVLTLTGIAPAYAYSAALQSVTFSTTSTSSVDRSIAVVATDGTLDSDPAQESVDVAPFPISISTSGLTNTFTVGRSPVAVDSGVTVYDYESDLVGATVTISPETLQPGDMLNFTNQNGISGNYYDGVLTLNGPATPDQYSAALQSVTFSTTNTNNIGRSIAIIATDGMFESDPAQETVDVAASPSVTLHSFSSMANQPGPVADLTLVGSTLFGVTDEDGSAGDGTIFSMNTDGSNYQVLHTFTGATTDGANPVAGLTLVGSTLYGTTEEGGSSNYGTVFSINTNGSGFQVLHSFTGNDVDGQNPYSGLTLDGSSLLGTTENGGSGFGGTIYSINTDGSGYQVLHSFAAGGQDGFWPMAGLTLVGSTVFGTTQYGGSQYSGTLFSMNVNGSGYQVLHAFQDTGTDGQNPATDLTVVGSTLVGATPYGGLNDGGTVFTINTDGSDYQIVHLFGSVDEDGGGPFAGWTLVGSTLYGATLGGGTNGDGTVFSVKPDGSDYEIQYSFGATDSDGQEPASGLTLGGSTLYGVTLAGGSYGDGAIFSLSGVTPNFMVTASNGSPAYAVGGPAVAVDSGVTVSSTDTDLTGATVTISPGTRQSGDLLNFVNQNGISGNYSGGVLTLSGSATPAQYEAALQSITFSSTSTSTTTRSIAIVAVDGDLVSNSAAEQVVIDAPVVTQSGTTSTFLVGGVAVAVDVGLAVGYDQTDLTGATVTISSGTLQSGDTLLFMDQNGISGSYSAGTLTLTGTATVANYQLALQSVGFSSTSTSTTARSIAIVANDGVLDSNAAAESVAVAIAVPVVGVPFQTVYTFGDFSNTGGYLRANLTAVGSTLFGTGEYGGSGGDGTIFSINADGSGAHVLHAFTGTGTDGANPLASLTLVGSTLFGTTEGGGSDGDGTVFSINTDGTGYRVLYSFTGTGSDGANPYAGLTVVGSTLYGTTEYGGSGNKGTVFSIHTDGTGYVVLHSFLNNDVDGELPVAGLTLVGSTLFGTTEWGGSYTAGTIFSINTDGSGYQIRYSFGSSDDGTNPESGLTLVGSTLFGTAYDGGSDGLGAIYSLDTSDDSYQTVYSFSGVDGRSPVAGLTLVGSTLFGTTVAGGSEAYGTVFSIQTDGTAFQVLHAFDYPSDPGFLPYGGLTLVGSTLIGTTLSSTMYTISDIAQYTAGGSAVAVSPGMTVALASSTTDIDGATVTISPATLQSGDTLHFTPQNGISGSYASGTLTLSGSATPAQYQAALDSVTFSSTSTSLTDREVSTVTFDAGDSQASNTVWEQIDISAPVTVTGAWVKNPGWGSSGTTNFFGYLASHSLGSATLGYALKTGASQLTDLPFANINTISVQFSGTVSNIGLGSLELVGGTGGGATGAATAAPSVTGFTSDGNNTYSWTLSGNLTNNKYVFAIATTGSSFGTPGSTQVTDANGAGISGTFTTGSSTFATDGNGLAGSTFDFFFNVLPGDGNQNGLVNSSDTAEAKSLANDHENAAAYNPYYDYNGVGLINTIDSALDGTYANFKQSGITSPSTPADSQAAGSSATAGFTALALAVQETGSSTSLTAGSSTSLTAGSLQASGSPTGSIHNVGSASATPAATASASAASNGSDRMGSESAVASNPATTSQMILGLAIDEAVSDFDLADLYV
jgi:uncharacterized repeat protein (TIGR03803 family)